MIECEYFQCGTCRLMYYPGMFGDDHPPDADGVIWAGPIEGDEESMSCTKKNVCKEYKPFTGSPAIAIASGAA